MIDLAKYPKKEDKSACCPSPSMEKPSYPEFTLRDEQYDKFMAEAVDPDIDDVLSIGDGMKVRVKGLRKDEYGRSVDLCVLSMDNISIEGKAEDEEEGDHKSRLKKALKGKSKPSDFKNRIKSSASEEKEKDSY